MIELIEKHYGRYCNIFMCSHEQRWLDECPLKFKPIFYRRYVDDTFLLFRKKGHAKLFLNYLNSKHTNINFTMENENFNSLSFLDVCVNRAENKFLTNVYRKPTFTGLGVSFFSFIPYKFKINALKTIIYRAYHICSNYHSLHKEFQFIISLFSANGFPKSLIEKSISEFLNKIYCNKPITYNVPKMPMYLTLPFFGPQSIKLSKELYKALTKHYPQINFNFILTTGNKMGNMFKFKDRLPQLMTSSLVYKFSCTSCSDVSYVGSTIRRLHSRICQHRGESERTGYPLSKPDHSNIRSHTETCNSHITAPNFKILATAKNRADLLILESIYIRKLKPVLNDNLSAYPLMILNET